MRRREYIALLGSAAVVQPRNVLAQQPNRARRIGVLMELAANDIQARSNIAALQRGLQTLGWQEGSNLGVDYRWAADDPVLLWKFARELVQLRPDVLVAASSPVVGTLLARPATSQSFSCRYLTRSVRISSRTSRIPAVTSPDSLISNPR